MSRKALKGFVQTAPCGRMPVLLFSAGQRLWGPQGWESLGEDPDGKTEHFNGYAGCGYVGLP